MVCYFWCCCWNACFSQGCKVAATRIVQSVCIYKSQIQSVVSVEDSFLFWLNQSTDARNLVDWLKKKNNNNLQSLQQADSRNRIASIIESVRGSLAWSRLHGMMVFTVDTSVTATGTNSNSWFNGIWLAGTCVTHAGSSLGSSSLAAPPSVKNAVGKQNVESKIFNPS